MSAQRIAQWLWWSGAAPARAARGMLLPFAFVYRTIMSARAKAYARGWLRQRPLPLPAVAIGNLAVGGAGKTPLAAWVAGYFARRGVKPGILLRGYRGDEQAVHQRLVPNAIVVPDPDRLAGARKAREQGARVLVLDDAYQRLNVGRDINIAVVSTESSPPRHVAWPLPAGPWREDWSALGRADVIVVTRRRAPLGVEQPRRGMGPGGRTEKGGMSEPAIIRPDKQTFLAEENPFEAMMERFDHAAKLLNLDRGLYKVLRNPEKQIITSLPIVRDNGEVDVFTGYRVLYNTSRGPA